MMKSFKENFKGMWFQLFAVVFASLAVGFNVGGIAKEHWDNLVDKSVCEKECKIRVDECRGEVKTLEQMYEQEKKNCDDHIKREALGKDPTESLRSRLFNKCPAECACVEDSQKELDKCTLLYGMCSKRLFEATTGSVGDAP